MGGTKEKMSGGPAQRPRREDISTLRSHGSCINEKYWDYLYGKMPGFSWKMGKMGCGRKTETVLAKRAKHIGVTERKDAKAGQTELREKFCKEPHLEACVGSRAQKESEGWWPQRGAKIRREERGGGWTREGP